MPAGDRFFVDTNVLLYSVDPADRVRQERAWAWLKPLWESRAGSLSWQVLHEFYANAVAKLGVGKPEARKAVRGYTHWAPVEASPVLVERAWHWMDQAQIAYWDALIVAASERSGCPWLLSEDFQDGRRFGPVTIVNPFLHGPAEFGLSGGPARSPR